VDEHEPLHPSIVSVSRTNAVLALLCAHGLLQAR
jgi:hypothetical protein